MDQGKSYNEILVTIEVIPEREGERERNEGKKRKHSFL